LLFLNSWNNYKEYETEFNRFRIVAYVEIVDL
jgi:hypothetical protein